MKSPFVKEPPSASPLNPAQSRALRRPIASKLRNNIALSQTHAVRASPIAGLRTNSAQAIGCLKSALQASKMRERGRDRDLYTLLIRRNVRMLYPGSDGN